MDRLEQLLRTVWWRKISSDQRSSQKQLRLFMQPADIDGVTDLQLGGVQLPSVAASTHRLELLDQLFGQRKLWR